MFGQDYIRVKLGMPKTILLIKCMGIISDAQGQDTPKVIVRPSLLSKRIKKIESNMKMLQPSQHVLPLYANGSHRLPWKLEFMFNLQSRKMSRHD